MSNLELRVKLLTKTAKLPSKAHPDDAGFDLYADVMGRDGPTYIWCRTRRLIPLGIAVAIPPGYYGRMAPRSGLANKHGIHILAGVIDSGYRGQLLALLLNTDADTPFAVNPGDKVAQLVIERIASPTIVAVEDLDETSRGQQGWGSTGIK